MKTKSKMSVNDVLGSIPTKGINEWRKEQAQYNERVELKLLSSTNNDSPLKETREEDFEVLESKEKVEMEEQGNLSNTSNNDNGSLANDFDFPTISEVDPDVILTTPALENNVGQDSEGNYLSTFDNNLKNESAFSLEPVADQRSNVRLDYFISKRKPERKLELGSISVKISFELKIKLDELRMDLNKGLRLSGQNHRAFALKEILEILYDEHIKII
jgi:hypothetical protein